MQAELHIERMISVIYHINRIKKKNLYGHIDSEKAFEKMHHPFMIKMLRNWE